MPGSTWGPVASLEYIPVPRPGWLGRPLPVGPGGDFPPTGTAQNGKTGPALLARAGVVG